MCRSAEGTRSQTELGGDSAPAVLQVDQGIGLGSTRPVFNRHRFSCTRFTPLGKTAPGSKGLRKVLVLHGRYGGCLGDLPPYDLFTLGGPFSVRPWPQQHHMSRQRWQLALVSAPQEAFVGHSLD